MASLSRYSVIVCRPSFREHALAVCFWDSIGRYGEHRVLRNRNHVRGKTTRGLEEYIRNLAFNFDLTNSIWNIVENSNSTGISTNIISTNSIPFCYSYSLKLANRAYPFAILFTIPCRNVSNIRNFHSQDKTLERISHCRWLWDHPTFLHSGTCPFNFLSGF